MNIRIVFYHNFHDQSMSSAPGAIKDYTKLQQPKDPVGLGQEENGKYTNE